MNKSEWKSAEEIRHSLRGADKITLFACGVCANLSNTGGHRGLKFLRKVLEEWGKEVVATKCITACCSEEIMKQAVRIYGRPISESDALVVVSCAAGVKSAFLSEPGVPVVAAADSVGSVPVSRREDTVARSRCTNCGHCVITYTGGICPLSECPAERKYEPCSRFSRNGKRCAVDPSRDCVWIEIAKRGDLEALKKLGGIHETVGEERLSMPQRRSSPTFIKKLSGMAVARAHWFGRFVNFVD